MTQKINKFSYKSYREQYEKYQQEKKHKIESQLKNLSTIYDAATLAKIMPGLIQSDLDILNDNLKVSTIVNLIEASLYYGIQPTSIQVKILNILYNRFL